MFFNINDFDDENVIGARLLAASLLRESARKRGKKREEKRGKERKREKERKKREEIHVFQCKRFRR